MKKLILSLVAAGFAATTFAYDGGGMQMGNMLLYGVGTYSSQHGTTTEKFGTANSNTSDNPRVRNWQVAPGVGFNITDNIAIGVDGYWGGSRYTIDRKNLGGFPSVDQVKTYNWGVGPFARYSCALSQHFFAFGQLGAHYNKGRETNRYVTALTGGNSYVADDNFKGFDVSFTPAVGAMLTKTLGLTFSVGGVGYEYRKYDFSPNSPRYYPGAPGDNFTAKTNDFHITFGQQFNLGIQKYFGCSKMRHGHAEPMDDTRHMDTSDDESDNNNSRRRRSRKNDDD